MDIYSTAFLSGVVDSLIRPQMFLLDRYFPNVLVSDTEEIYFDVANSKRRIAPFVSPKVEGKVVESLGYTTNHFKPAYVKDKRVFDPARALKRAAGERIGGSMTPMDRSQANLTVESQDQMDMLNRRLEVMASEVLRTGKATIEGDGFPTVVVDFLRAAGHTIVLGGGSQWGDAGVVPIEDLEDWALTVLKASGSQPVDVTMDIDAWRKFRTDSRTLDIIDKRRGSITSEAELASAPATGGQLVARVEQFRIWLYSDWYIDPADDLEYPILPSGTVIMSSGQIEGVRHFGAILDEEAGLQARELFSKSWVVPDPSRRLLLMQSAPLLAPYRPNASLAATVL